jgi:hypothetical protein
MKATSFSRCCAAAALVLLAGSGMAQEATVSSGGGGGATTVRTGSPQRDTLTRLMRRMSVDFNEKRLEDVVSFIKDFANADIETMWMDDKHPEGLDKDRVISVKVDNVTVLSLLEKVLEKAAPDAGGEATWQMSDSGTFQMGPRERLNKSRRVQIYDINDLLMDVPDYRDVPQIDLQQALQASQGGGGGGQSPFRDQQQQEDRQERDQRKQEQADELATLIRDLVEPDQWIENGGSGGSIKFYKGTLIVNAPDYIHRGINGYRYWPATKTIAMKDQKGRRYVTLGVDTGISTVDGFGQQPVTAVVGGQPVSSGPPGGGGNKAKKPAGKKK